MELYELVAPCHFGLEAVMKREILDLGYEIERVELQPVSGVSFLFLIVQVIHLNQSAGDRIHKAASTICCS